MLKETDEPCNNRKSVYGRLIRICQKHKLARGLNYCRRLYSVEITYGINSIISKLMTFVESAEIGQFLFLVIRILSYFICS
jgi:hypothetical protein